MRLSLSSTCGFSLSGAAGVSKKAEQGELSLLRFLTPEAVCSVIIRMGAEDTVRRFLICIACLAVLKILESWLLGSWLMQEEETRTKIRDPLVSHPRYV